VEMRRFAPADRLDRRRILSAYGRFSDTPAELVVELAPDGLSYSTHGTRQEATQRERAETIDGILPVSEQEAITGKEVLESWPDGSKPGRRTIDGDLKSGAN